MTNQFTVVFNGDIKEREANPFYEETPFGRPDTIGIGNAFTQLEEAREWLKAALNMVEGNGMPPNWDGIREFLKQ